MPLPQTSFSRSEIGIRTGLDDDTLSYWIRAGLLIAEHGGGGKGRHRHFSRLELALAVLLSRLRTLGISSTALSPLAERFHAAQRWLRENSLDVVEVGEVNKLVQARSAQVASARTTEEASAQWKVFLKQKTTDPWFELDQKAIRLAETVPVEEWNLHQQFHETLVTIALKRPMARERYVLLSRQGDGDWHFLKQGDPGDALRVSLRSLGQQIWEGDE